jgi:biofilm protein TabA
MIICRREYMAFYHGLSESLDTAFAWIEKGGWEGLPIRRHPIDGDKVFALFSEYETKAPENCRYETHRSYIDIQMLISGREYIMVRGAAGLPVSTPWTPDIEFLDGGDAVEGEAPKGVITDIHRIALVPGIAVVLFPEEAHKPCMRILEKSETVHKVVLKVAV